MSQHRNFEKMLSIQIITRFQFHPVFNYSSQLFLNLRLLYQTKNIHQKLKTVLGTEPATYQSAVTMQSKHATGQGPGVGGETRT